MSSSNDTKAAEINQDTPETLIEALRDVVRRQRDGEFPNQAAKFAERLLKVVETDSGFLEQIVATAIPSEAMADLAFYDHLANLRNVLGYDTESFRLCGLVWRECLTHLEPQERIPLLVRFPTDCGNHLFELLPSLRTVLEHVHVSADVAAPWFKRLRDAIGDDLANAGYWAGIDIWTKVDPANAAQVLRQLPKTKPNDHDLAFGARILANLRVQESEPPGAIEITEFDDAWATSPDSKTRTIYHHSWAETVMLRGITDSEVLQFLQRFEFAEGEELAACFNFIRCLIVSGKIPANSIDPVLQWIRDHARPDIEALWKHWICVSCRAVWADENSNWTILQRTSLREAIIEIQPIPLEHKGTWREVDQLLAHSMKSSDEGTVDFIQRLFDRHPESFTELLDRSNRSLLFFMELAAYPRLQELVANLFSANMDRRRFGLSLINSGLPLNLSKDLLKNTSERHLALGLLQIRFDQLNPKQTCSLLLQMLPRIEKASQQLQSLLSEELAFQARNLPGLCLERFKKVKKPSPLLKSAIAEAESYFEQLRSAADSPVAAMHVPGLNQARRSLRLRQSRMIDEKSREGSVFLEFMKSVHLLYGRDGSAYYQHNRLSEPTPFQSFSTSAEIPRLDTMDYDGQKLRRHQTLMQIHSVEEQLQKFPNARES